MASYIDNFSAESILVIKKPPVSAPTIVPFITASQNDFLEERFLCFAYRYEYQNGEFSAVSQFSDPAFLSKPFFFSYNSYLNEGMINSANAVSITYNTGGPLVTGIELLFKEMNDPTIKVIERIDKASFGYANDDIQVYVFDNQKIFTVLPEYEILRLYDNVPRTAKSQALMGNRLIYGNYVEGYDLRDRFNNPVNFSFESDLKSSDVGLDTVPDSTEQGNYNISGTLIFVDDSRFVIDLSEYNNAESLISGAVLSFQFRFQHNSFVKLGGGSNPTATTTSTDLLFSYVLPQNFGSIYALATSSDFQARVGTSAIIKTVPNSCDGTTLTDQFNCVIPNSLDGFVKTASGNNALDQPISVIVDANNTSTIGFQLLAMKFLDPALPAETLFEYYTILSGSATYRKINNAFSLHSNRGYEVGMVYMDEFNRSSTALVSPLNTVHIPCGNSPFVNSIQVTIPGGSGVGSTSVVPPQIAPWWATRYKFVIKPSKSTYETIYANEFYNDPVDNYVFFLLEGENANKVEAGDRLIVKRDSQGPRGNCTYATVLEKETQLADFLTIEDPLNPGQDPQENIPIQSGVYMKISPNNFTISNNQTPGGDVFQPGPFTTRGNLSGGNPDSFALNAYPVNITNPTGSGATSYVDVTIPAGSSSVMNFRFARNRAGTTGKACNSREYVLEIENRAQADYDNFKEYWDSQNLGDLVDTGVFTSTDASGDEQQLPFINTYLSTLITQARDPLKSDFSTIDNNNFWQFFRNSATNQLFLCMVGGPGCREGFFYSGGSRFHIEVDIVVDRSDGTIVFETIPTEALPDVWYENDLSFSIDANGQHTGNVQNQQIAFQNTTGTTPKDAIIDTGFYDCIAFGNGVESYKIRDSINGKALTYGNRVTTTSAQIFREADRFADLTYSGIFNDESNVNRLNEFNLGLLNFKPLEDSYGPIEKLDGRRTDILVLQEDKISYVLVGKDLLSDASGGGALTSVPQVLGTQIARAEAYGISNNPESYASYGADKFFTDSKRGAVIQLRGSSAQNDQLKVISQFGMRGWFRDFFINTIGNQKLGGFDPYMNEFVLASNGQSSSEFTSCLACGVSENVTVNPGRQTIYCVNVGQEIGSVVIDYIIPNALEDNIITEVNTPAGSLQVMETEAGVSPITTEETNTGVGYTITAYYNGVQYSTGLVFISGKLIISKNIVDVSQVTIEVTTSSTVADSIQITTECPVENLITLYNIAITSNSEAGEFVHNQYTWTDGSFTSPLHSNLVSFTTSANNPIVSQYQIVTGSLGAGVIPNEGAIVSIISNKIGSDNFVFNSTSNKFQYLRSSTVYANNATDILALISAASTASPIINNSNNTNQFYADFVMPTGTIAENNLYLIWDYRQSTAEDLNRDTTASLACAGSAAPVAPCNTQVAFSGGESFPSEYNLTLGSTTGVVTLTFDAQNLPEKFIIEFDGAEVLNTGYRGSTAFQGDLNSALALKGLPPETITAPGNGTASFTKSTTTATATLKVFGPLPNTLWTATLSCPV